MVAGYTKYQHDATNGASFYSKSFSIPRVSQHTLMHPTRYPRPKKNPPFALKRIEPLPHMISQGSFTTLKQIYFATFTITLTSFVVNQYDIRPTCLMYLIATFTQT